MPMVTRCPSCGTLFRVTPQQLQAHRGQVRCGRCMTVFDGFTMLATLPDQGAPEPGSRAVPERASTIERADAAPDLTVVSAQGAAGEEAGPARIAAAGEQVLEAAAASAPVLPGPPEAHAAVASVVATRELAPVPEPADSSESTSQTDLPPAPRRLSRGWLLGSALLLLMLGGQAFYAYRVELVANYPELKPVAHRFCEFLGCSVPLPQRPKLITIEASDLQVQDPLRPGVIQLTATLRNHAGVEVGYPALDLVLTNTKEHTLARRIFMPEEYLDRGRSAGAGLPANAEVTVRLALDTGDLGAAGFRLALLPGR